MDDTVRVQRVAGAPAGNDIFSGDDRGGTYPESFRVEKPSATGCISRGASFAQFTRVKSRDLVNAA